MAAAQKKALDSDDRTSRDIRGPRPSRRILRKWEEILPLGERFTAGVVPGLLFEKQGKGLRPRWSTSLMRAQLKRE